MLRPLLFSAFLAVVFAAKSYNPMEQQIIAIIEAVCDIITPVDPAKIDEAIVNVDEEIVTLYLLLKDVLVQGFSQLSVKDVTATEQNMELDLRFKDIDVDIPLYKLKGLAIFIPFFGDGLINVRLEKLVIILHSDLTLKKGEIIGVKNLKLDFKLETSKLRITGLLDNPGLSDLVSTAITECLPVFINSHGARFGELIAPYAEEILNDILMPPPFSTVGNIDVDEVYKQGDYYYRLYSARPSYFPKKIILN